MKAEKKQRKDPNKMDIILRLSTGDGLIFDVLDKCESRNKTDLIKNALFYYILHIQNGMAIDKSYPYGAIQEIHVDGLNRYLPITNSIIDPSRIPNHIEEDEYDDTEYDNEDDYDQDNYDQDDYEYEEDDIDDEDDDEYEDNLDIL